MEEKRRVLIVDPSRVARAALAKHLSAEYDLREESDGELAWQTLVLDPSIVAVVAALTWASVTVTRFCNACAATACTVCPICLFSS